jgi:hypothetical protein
MISSQTAPPFGLMTWAFYPLDDDLLGVSLMCPSLLNYSRNSKFHLVQAAMKNTKRDEKGKKGGEKIKGRWTRRKKPADQVGRPHWL